MISAPAAGSYSTIPFQTRVICSVPSLCPWKSIRSKP